MKYVIVFILVLLTSLGLLQLLGKEESIEPAEKNIEEEINLTDLVEDSTYQISETDTSSYTIVDGFYNISWKHLSRVDFEEKLNTEFNTMIAYPIFHPSIKKLDGKKIQIKGYVIPFEETGDATIVILSAFPFTSCFFCGGAGPETVIDVQLKKQSTRFKQDAMVTFRGKLRLNDSDLDYLNYILDDAEILKE